MNDAELDHRAPKLHEADDAMPLQALLATARKLARTGDPQRALHLGREACERAERAADPGLIAASAEVVADANLAASSYPEAAALYLEALAQWSRLADVPGQVRCLRGAAEVDMQVGEYSRSMDRLA